MMMGQEIAQRLAAGAMCVPLAMSFTHDEADVKRETSRLERCNSMLGPQPGAAAGAWCFCTAGISRVLC